MRNYRSTIFLILISITFFFRPADAKISFMLWFNDLYPESPLVNNCNICHITDYRSDWILNAKDFTAIEMLDSDGDGVLNIVEIAAGSNPGNSKSYLSEVSGSFTYYLPYYTSLPDFWTGVALRNRESTKSAVVNIYTYDNNGINIATELKAIPSNGQTAFVAGKNLGKEGWIKINSTTQLAGLCFFGTTGSNSYMADISFIGALATDLIVPHVAQNGTWDTTIMVCNPGVVAAEVALSFVNPDGTVLYSKNYTVSANGSKQIELSDLVESTTQEQGSVEISSDTGVAAFALYKNFKTGGYSYAGISAVE